MAMVRHQKPLASLSSILLARKGEAKPAMRPQATGAGHEDLGWNDIMGRPEETAVPPVLIQREALHEEFRASETVAPEPVPVGAPQVVSPTQVSLATATRIGRETRAKHGRAAFTLRLDHDRHLRLRLASALHQASAQVLVTEALDRFLETLPEVEELVRQLPTKN